MAVLVALAEPAAALAATAEDLAAAVEVAEEEAEADLVGVLVEVDDLVEVESLDALDSLDTLDAAEVAALTLALPDEDADADEAVDAVDAATSAASDDSVAVHLPVIPVMEKRAEKASRGTLAESVAALLSTRMKLRQGGRVCVAGGQRALSQQAAAVPLETRLAAGFVGLTSCSSLARYWQGSRP